LIIENYPKFGSNLYRTIAGPRASFSVSKFNIFGSGDNWHNRILGDYRLNMGNGKKDYYLDKDSLNISKRDLITKPSLYHKTNFDAPIQNIFGWLKIRPHIDLTEYWIWTYKEENIISGDTLTIEKGGFKRRLTWNSSLSANTKIYGLFPITIGRLNAIRHVITPTISYNYTPDFSNPRFGYFQQNNPSGKSVDYFQEYSPTPKNEKRYYSLSINNRFQAKIHNENGGYDKINFLTLNSSISYDPLEKGRSKLKDLTSNMTIKNLSGRDLVRISMGHNFYTLDEEKLIDIWKG
jgi:hypothetical protein